MASSSHNTLLSELPRAVVRELLGPNDPVRLETSQVLVEQGESVRYAYFPIDGFVSLLTAPFEGAAALEVALVGYEGMVGASLLLGVEVSPLRALVQGDGLAWRVDARRFRHYTNASRKLRDFLNRYLYVQHAQLAQTAACTRFHVVESRLARWLLMTRDRARSREFYVTQGFLAYMLGVRRVGVTRAASSLRRRKLIRYSRGNIAISDETGLEKAACSCYFTDREMYDRVLGKLATYGNAPSHAETKGATYGRPLRRSR
jgi:CRP-like cAMP-binding protein